MSTLQQNRMRTLLPEEALSRVARCRRTPKVTFRSAKTGSSEVRVRACSSSGELVGSEQPRKQAKKPFGITIRFPTFRVSLLPLPRSLLHPDQLFLPAQQPEPAGNPIRDHTL